MRVGEVLHSTWIVRRAATIVLCVFLATGGRANAADPAINPAAIPVPGGAKGEDRAAELNTWTFGANGDLHVSGGEAGDGTDGKYEQDGGRVIISVADDRFIASYDGENLTFGLGASSNPKVDTDIPSLAGKTLTTRDLQTIDWWTPRHEAILKRVSEGNVDLVFWAIPLPTCGPKVFLRAMVKKSGTNITAIEMR